MHVPSPGFEMVTLSLPPIPDEQRSGASPRLEHGGANSRAEDDLSGWRARGGGFGRSWGFSSSQRRQAEVRVYPVIADGTKMSVEIAPRMTMPSPVSPLLKPHQGLPQFPVL